MMGFGFDPYWFLAIPGLLLGLYAQFKLRSSYGHYSEVPAESGLTGAEAARVILDRNGLQGMPVNEVPGELTDHYDPTKKALFLSTANFHGRSLAAVGVAAHEAGHALQHKQAYGPLHLRMALVPAVGIASRTVWFIVLAGFLLNMFHAISPAMAGRFIGIAVGLFSVVTLFQLITLPVEYDASRRAKQQLASLGLVSQREAGGVARVLSAAALTYVAAMVASVLELLRLILIMRSFQDRER